MCIQFFVCGISVMVLNESRALTPFSCDRNKKIPLVRLADGGNCLKTRTKNKLKDYRKSYSIIFNRSCDLLKKKKKRKENFD